MPRDARITTRVVPYGDSKLRVRELHVPATGDEQRHTFVLVHGIGVSSRYFEPLAAALAEHGDVYLLDLPGFGGIPRPNHSMTIRHFAEAVHLCIDAEGIVDPVLVGHSMGAQVVTELLASYPITDAAVLIGPPGNPDEPGAARTAWRFLQSSLAESPKIRLVAMAAYAKCAPSWFVEVMPGMLGFPMAERLGRVRARTLVVWGEHDALTPRSWVDRMLTELPDGAEVEIKGAAHNIVYENAHEVASAVVEHLG